MVRRKTVLGHERMIHIRLDHEVHRRLRVHVADLDTSIQAWVEELIERELQTKAGRKR